MNFNGKIKKQSRSVAESITDAIILNNGKLSKRKKYIAMQYKATAKGVSP